MKNSFGFSLIELIITIAIIAILAGIGIPNYQSTVQNNKIDTTRELLHAAISYGKNTAMAQNRTIIMTLEENTLTFTTDPSSAISTINKMILTSDSHTQINYVTAADNITFRSNGTLAKVNNITHCFNDNMVTFQVRLSGLIEEANATCE